MAATHKIIITGTGRAGTTVLMRLLTELGAPTGYDRRSWKADYCEPCAAGLERDITEAGTPYIIKNPELCTQLAAVLARGDIVIDHAIIPVRELEAATRSRVRIGGVSGERPGGLIGTSDPAQQRAVLAERFHELVHTLVAHDIPHTFLEFPRFVLDPSYTYSRLARVFPGVRYDDFVAAFQRIANPTMVHDFSAQTPVIPVPAPSTCPLQRRKSPWRHVRRTATWMTVTAAAALIGRVYLPSTGSTSFEAPSSYAKVDARTHAGLPAALRLWPVGDPYRQSHHRQRAGYRVTFPPYRLPATEPTTTAAPMVASAAGPTPVP